MVIDVKSGRGVTLNSLYGSKSRNVTVLTSDELMEVKSLSKSSEYEGRTEAILLPILEANGFECVDVEYVKERSNWFLRCYIDKPGGITIDDCELVSRALSDKLDDEDFIDDAYILEISSPGLGRTLKKEKDFMRSIGQEVEIHTFRPIDKQKDFYGILDSFSEDSVTILAEDDTKQTLMRKDIAQIRLAFDF